MEHARWLKSLTKDAGRVRIAQARKAVASARQHKRTATRRARETCKAAREGTRAWVKSAREELREEIAQMREQLRAQVEKKRAAVAECCGPDKRRVREREDAKIEALRNELAELVRDRQLEQTWANKTPKRTRARKVEARTESDALLEQNLSPDELTVWRQVKDKIPAGTARMSRLERFQHWMHEHSADVERILIEDAESQLDQAIEAEERERRELADLRKALRKRPDDARAYVRKTLDAVPF